MNFTYSVRSIIVPEGEVAMSTTGGEPFEPMFAGCRVAAAYAFSAKLM